MLARFYNEELDFLRDMAREFAVANPGVVANALQTPGADPDVERLLEGFAFLAARVRQRLEDDFPEIVHALTGLLWPQFLRATPSGCVVEFSAEAGKLRDRRQVEAGVEVKSVEAPGGVECQFRTCWDFDVLPITVAGARLDQAADGRPILTLSFRLMKEVRYADVFRDAANGGLRLFLHEGRTARSLLDAFSRKVERIELRRPAHEGASAAVAPLPLSAIRFPGLEPQRSVVPEPPRAFSAFALLHDYFAFPERYLFVDVAGLDRARELGGGSEFELVFRLTDWPDGLRRVDPSNFRLGCVPVVNVFESDARPIRVARERSEYPLVADMDGANEMETYAVLGMNGIAEGGDDRAFAALYSLEHRAPRSGDAQVYYHTHVRPSLRPPRTETWFSLIDTGDAGSIPPLETIAARLLCTNGDVPTTLGPGDVREPTFSTPDGVQFRDITRMMPPVPPPLDGKTSWKLVSLIATSYLSIADRDNLRTLLRLMDFRSAHDKSAEQKLQLRLEAIESVTVDADDWLVRGRMVRGRAVTIAVRDRKFGGTGEVHLFGSVLDAVLAMFSSINSHTRLTIVGKDSGEEFRWKPRHGTQILQ